MKKIIKLFSIFLIMGVLCGCEFDEEFSDDKLYTTSYPIEYATKELYSNYADISSIYPNGTDETYEITNKKKEIYSKGQIFIYEGLANEAYIAKDLINLNANLKIIDSSKGLNLDNGVNSSWIDPSNYLMLCNNIKQGLINVNDNIYKKEDIEKNYKKLNEKISELDVSLYDIGKNGNYDTILVNNNLFNYLTKYNINVISIDDNNKLLDKAYANAKEAIKNKKIKYIFYLEGTEFTDTQKKFISENSVTKIEINSLFTLSEDERKQNKDYITLMNEIIDTYKKELYKK